jgi:hypothetical protein
MHDAHPLLQVARHHGPLEELGPAFIRLEEHHGGLRPCSSDNQTGEPSARPEIKDPGAFPLCLRTAEVDEPSGVAQMTLDRPGPEESGIARSDEDLLQLSRNYPILVGVRHRRLPGQPAGAMTM